MRRRLHILLAFLVLATHARLAPGADTPPAVADIDVVVHLSVPTETFDRAALAAVFSMTRRSWGGGLDAVPFNYPPDNPLRRTFDQAVLNLAPAEVGRFWIDQRIRGLGHPPRQIADPAMVLRLVGSLKGSIGYVPAGTADKSVRVVAKIRKGKVTGP